MIKKLWSIYKKYQEAIDYLIWGGIAFVLSMFLFWLFAGLWGWGEVLANTVDWVICVLFTFVTNKLFVFRSKTSNMKEFGKEFVEFVLARFFTLVLEDIIILIGCTYMKYDSGIGQIVVKLIAQFVVIVSNYFLSKLWIFKKKDIEEKDTISEE